jgi:2-polyprenyl-3-methyl-5-hydroxy-6-metoxy-1,4-benzoquinol methylase
MEPNEKQTSQDVQSQWDTKAAFWDQLMGTDGNRFHRELVSPVVERLLSLRPGERVLDVACGTGILARRMAALGADVTAVDYSQGMLERAQAHEQLRGNPVVYRQVDVTDEAALAALGEAAFSAVTCSMALMDIPGLEGLFRGVVRVLKPGGRFVFATAHPAFNSNNPVFGAEMADIDGQLVTTHFLKVAAYLDLPPALAMGAREEPNPHTYFHRPLSALLTPAFAAGLVLDALEEPGFEPDQEQAARPLSWYSLPQIPPVLAGRMQLTGGRQTRGN